MVRSLIRDSHRFPGELAIWDQAKDSLIPRSRSGSATKFMDQGFGDVVVMIDHDIEWADGDLAYIVKAAKQEHAIVGGAYSQRTFGRGYALRLWPESPPIRLGEEAIYDVEYVGTGFIAIHRSVLEKLARVIPRTRHGYHPFFALDYPWTDGEVEELSEDYAFCKRAREMAGVRSYLAAKPYLLHHGSYAYRQFDASWTPPPEEPVTLVAVDPSKPVDVPGVGQFFIDTEDRFVSAALQRGQPWEPAVLKELEALGGKTRTLVEVGAHFGAHTVPAAKWYRNVIAVEPLYADRLRRNLALNEIDASVIQAAVNGAAGKAFMRRDFNNPGASHLADYGEEVNILPLADILPKRGKCILKMDIEGAEYGALKDAPLERVGAMILEYSEGQLARVSNATPRQFVDMLTAAGFPRLRYVGTSTEATLENLPTGDAYCNIVAERA